MSNTPFFIYWDIFYRIYQDIFYCIYQFFLSYLLGYPFRETLYLRLHQCFFLGASCCSPNFCFSTRR